MIGRGELNKMMLWWAFWVTIINGLLYIVFRSGLPCWHGHPAACEEAIFSTLGAISVPWILVGGFCLLAKLFRKGSFRTRMLQASPVTLAFGLLSTFTLLEPLWNL